MPNENEAGEALQAVAEAIERVDDNSDTIRPEDPDPRKGRGARFKAWMKQSASFMTHIVALLAAFGAFLKTCDHSVTKNAYDTLSANITKLSDNQEKLGQDVANIHGYLEGLSHQPMPAWGNLDAGAEPVVVVPTSAIPSPPPPVWHPHPKPSPSPLPSSFPAITFLIDDGGLPLAPAAPAQAMVLPPANAPPPPVKPPPFSAVEAAK